MSAYRKNIVPLMLATVLVGAAVVIAALVLTLQRKRRTPLPRFSRLTDFQLVERSGRSVNRADIAGKILVADFFFGGCSAECQVVNQRMCEVQQLTAGMKEVLLVSITVDPKSDTPAALTRYAAQLGASTNRWLFLTGEKTNIYPLIQNSFLLSAVESDSVWGPSFIHSSKIALVDGHGSVRGYYDGLAALAPHWILEDIRKLRSERSPLISEADSQTGVGF